MSNLADLKDFKLSEWNGSQIILYGGGYECKYIIRGLVKLGLLDWLICDKNGYKCPVGSRNNGVILPEELKNYPAANIIISSSKYAQEILDSLSDKGFNESSIFLARDLTTMGVCDVPAIRPGEYRSKNRYIYSIATTIAKSMGFGVISNVELPITTRCTLKCRDCGNKIPYCRKHEDVDEIKTIKSLDNLFTVGCYIEKLEFIGGEPLLNQSLMVKILRRYCGSPHIGKFTVVTNGTLLLEPETIEAMQECGNVTVIISDYGELSCKMDELIAILLDAHIDFARLDKYILWEDNGREFMLAHPNGYLDDKGAQKRFNACSEKGICSTLYDGKLSVCGNIPFVIEAGFIPEFAEDVVDVMETKGLKERCLAYMDRKNFLQTCKYCPDLHRLVDRAVQLN